MRPETRDAAMRVLLEGAFTVELNMSDTFAFACADSETFDMDDFEEAAPVLAQFGHHALTAYAALRRGQEPIECRCCHKGEAYQGAKTAFEAIRLEHPEFAGGPR